MSEQPRIGLLDYGMGNRRSVQKALEHVGASVLISSDPDELRACPGLVVPGVGAFPKAMARLRELGLDELLGEHVAAARPLLGICLGMQLAFERSSEHGGAEGLGLLAGEVHELRHDGLKLPHIGWNEVALRVERSPLLQGLPERCAFYHVHSFAPLPADEQDVLGLSTYAAPFASVVARGSFHGVQFHPEKSSAAGLRLLANFASICARGAAPVAS